MYKFKFAFILLCTGFAMMAQAQTYKLNKTQGKLIIEGVNELVVEGYSGNEIVFERVDYDHEDNEKAKGLMALSAEGLKDNSGVGLSVVESGAEVKVKQIGRNSDDSFKIKVPNGISVYYSHSSHNGEDIIFKNVVNEIEVSVNYNSVILENVTGPMAINTVYGDVIADFKSVAQNNSITLHSVYGDVDVSLPNSTSADLLLSTSYGEMFTDFDITLEANQNTSSKGCNGCGSKNKFSGKINGGGVSISLKSNYDNIYLRKK